MSLRIKTSVSSMGKNTNIKLIKIHKLVKKNPFTFLFSAYFNFIIFLFKKIFTLFFPKYFLLSLKIPFSLLYLELSKPHLLLII